MLSGGIYEFVDFDEAVRNPIFRALGRLASFLRSTEAPNNVEKWVDTVQTLSYGDGRVSDPRGLGPGGDLLVGVAQSELPPRRDMGGGGLWLEGVLEGHVVPGQAFPDQGKLLNWPGPSLASRTSPSGCACRATSARRSS